MKNGRTLLVQQKYNVPQFSDSKLRQISNTMEAIWCREIVEAATEKYGCPIIFNTDQGSQFTSKLFVDYLQEHHITISMDGSCRATDNIYIERFWRSVKQEKTYLNAIFITFLIEFIKSYLCSRF